MGQALYRKYRSKSLDEIVGQEHITTTLKNALKSGKISHAYLLTGPRGVGKTSVARILAHEVNGLPYDEQAHLDIIEIDAASNRRIDEVRDLRDKVHILPTSAKYKVYIIDEVHMLTREAFNALLKTLEEPPAHVIFILATTESHKLPETIISRTQHFAFKPIGLDELTKHLSQIAKQENVSIEAPAVELIARHGGGSFRDSISLLDQVHSIAEHITLDDVQRLLGLAPGTFVDQLLDALGQHDVPTVLRLLGDARGQGISAGKLAEQLNASLRERLISQGTGNVALMRQLVEVASSPQPEQWLELCLLEAALNRPAAQNTHSQPIPTTAELAPKSPVSVSIPVVKQAILEPKPKPAPADNSADEMPEPDNSSKPLPTALEASGIFSVDDWPAVLAAIKKKHNTLYGILRMAEPSMKDSKTLTLTFRFAFHEKQLKDKTKQAIVTGLINELFGVIIALECALQAKALGEKPKKQPTKDTQALDTVSNIFGGAEVLES